MSLRIVAGPRSPYSHRDLIRITPEMLRQTLLSMAMKDSEMIACYQLSSETLDLGQLSVAVGDFLSAANSGRTPDEVFSKLKSSTSRCLLDVFLRRVGASVLIAYCEYIRELEVDERPSNPDERILSLQTHLAVASHVGPLKRLWWSMTYFVKKLLGRAYGC